MTFREKLKQRHPALVDEEYAGGAYSCPARYGWEAKRPDFCRPGDEARCRECWDREIPGTEPAKKIGSICLGVEVKNCKDCQEAGELRPCEVDGQRCYFHRFIEEERGVLQINAFMRPENVEKVRRMYEEDGVMTNACTLEKLRHAYALVEFPDGTVKKVEPEKVRFLDREG